MGDKEKGTVRKYYAQRKGRYPYLEYEKILELFKKEILYHLQVEGYLIEAEGFIDDEIFGTWGRDIPTYILKTLRMENIWPFYDHIKDYDITTFFTVIEFIYDNVSKEVKVGKKGESIVYEKEPAQNDYREKVNDLLALYCHTYSTGSGEDFKVHEAVYELSKNGEIQEKLQDGFKELIEDIPQTGDTQNIDDKVDYAISQYLRYGVTLEEKKDAIRTLGDVLEFLRASGIAMPKDDDKDLRDILNKFSIRHHNASQKSNYSCDEWYEFFFYLFLSSINLLLKLNEYES